MQTILQIVWSSGSSASAHFPFKHQHVISESRYTSFPYAIEYNFLIRQQIKKLKELRAMLMETDPCVAVTVRKLVMVSLMEIFKDIVPSYRIRPLTEAEKSTKVQFSSSVEHTLWWCQVV